MSEEEATYRKRLRSIESHILAVQEEGYALILAQFLNIMNVVADFTIGLERRKTKLWRKGHRWRCFADRSSRSGYGQTSACSLNMVRLLQQPVGLCPTKRAHVLILSRA
jgi:hypothetical protein